MICHASQNGIPSSHSPYYLHFTLERIPLPAKFGLSASLTIKQKLIQLMGHHFLILGIRKNKSSCQLKKFQGHLLTCKWNPASWVASRKIPGITGFSHFSPTWGCSKRLSLKHSMHVTLIYSWHDRCRDLS